MAQEVLGTLKNLVVLDAHINAAAAIDRTKMATRTLANMGIPLTHFRVWDALGSLPPTAGSSDDLGLVTQTFGTTPPILKTGDSNGTALTQRVAAILCIPYDYKSTGSMSVRIAAGMITTVADTTATVDCEVYVSSKTGSLNGTPTDICTTAAQSINSLTAANKDFTLDPSLVTAGDTVIMRLTIATNDASGAGGAVFGAIYDVALRADIL